MGVVFLPVILLAFAADIRGCVCDPARSDTMEGRECSLTHVATLRSDGAPAFFIKDANPTKPNRWLAIPHSLHHSLSDMTEAGRTALWTAAIEKARALWSDRWAVAVNADEKRTQCQLHIHIGKLLDDADTSGGVIVDGIAEIPVPPAASGIWVHPEGDKLRVHSGEPAGELKLMR